MLVHSCGAVIMFVSEHSTHLDIPRRLLVDCFLQLRLVVVVIFFLVV